MFSFSILYANTNAKPQNLSFEKIKDNFETKTLQMQYGIFNTLFLIKDGHRYVPNAPIITDALQQYSDSKQEYNLSIKYYRLSAMWGIGTASGYGLALAGAFNILLSSLRLLSIISGAGLTMTSLIIQKIMGTKSTIHFFNSIIFI